MKIAIIGTGNLGKAIAKGLVKSQNITSLYLTKRNISDLEEFEDNKHVIITQNNTLAIQKSDIILLAVQPAQASQILIEAKSVFTKNHNIISTITGFSIAAIEQCIGQDKAISRAMPNTAIAVGKSMTCLCCNNHAKKQINIAETIFNKLGHSLLIPESQMQAATVVCASGIAFWMRLIRATTQAAIQLGFDAKEAQELAMHTSEGAASLLIQNKRHPEQEIDQVTTPKGCTIEGLNEMEHKGLSAALIQGMVASFTKINSIKKEQL